MMLAAWPQLAAAGELQLWLGAFRIEMPPPPPASFHVNGQPVQPLQALAWFPIRDRHTGAGGQPVNHQAIVRLPATGPDLPHRVAISVDGQTIERTVFSLPDAVPQKMHGTFNLLLSSCYFQPDDGGLLGTVVSQLPVRPHMTLLAGDQVYVDLPLLEDLPEHEPALSRFIGDKYQRNWLSGTLGSAGLETVLARAPTVCLPDDHEFWNNYPFFQAQLPGTWTAKRRDRWAEASQALYEDYQHGGAPGSTPGFRRHDIAPLCILMLDTRCRRLDDLVVLMAPDASAAVLQWEADLLAARDTADPRVGVLAGGQALFMDTPSRVVARWKDAEYANYAQFELVIGAALARLADAGVPVVFLTGDVHWGRVAQALHRPSNRVLLHEVVCSPSRLIQAMGKSRPGPQGDRLLGPRETWPRHDDPPDPPPYFGTSRQFEPTKVFCHRGDQVALVQFSRTGRGVDLQVTYHAIHADPDVARPRTTGPYPLLPL